MVLTLPQVEAFSWLSSESASSLLLAWLLFRQPSFGSAKSDPDQFQRGFEEGFLNDKFVFFEAILSYECPIPERRQLLAK